MKFALASEVGVSDRATCSTFTYGKSVSHLTRLVGERSACGGAVPPLTAGPVGRVVAGVDLGCCAPGRRCDHRHRIDVAAQVKCPAEAVPAPTVTMVER